MYNEVVQEQKGNATMVRNPELIESLNGLKYQNDYMEDVTLSIKEKLRSILKWEQPEQKEMDKIPEMIVNSAVDELNYQVKRQRKLNEKLSDILLHLKEIV